ncbi:MAG: hypothetical protein IPK72_10540 [Candidatus Eisenbacteria bacterium]|nr:hypothetical protein [Candidatus Eisenbacteria bacterium]
MHRPAAPVAKGGHHSWAGEAAASESIFSEAIRLADPQRQTNTHCHAAMWLGHSLVELGRPARAEAVLRAAIPVAVRVGDRERERFMRMSLASLEHRAGNFEPALSGFVAAGALLRAAGIRIGELDAFNGQGRTWQQIGELDRARALYREVADLSHRAGLRETEVDALNNLGANELYRGDPAAALDTLRAAHRTQRALRNPHFAVLPSLKVAKALVQRGRFSAAEATMESLMIDCRTRGDVGQQAAVLNAQGGHHLGRGATAGALHIYRLLASIGASIPVERRLQGHIGAARCLAGDDRTEEALAILQAPARRLLPLAPAEVLMEYERVRGECLFRREF